MSISINSEGLNERLDGLLELCKVQSHAHREGIVYGLPLCEGLTIQRRVECGNEAVVAKGFGVNLFENAFAMEQNVSQSDLETIQVREIHLLHCPCFIDVSVSTTVRNSEEILKGEAGSECLIRHGTKCFDQNAMSHRELHEQQGEVRNYDFYRYRMRRTS